VHPPSAPRTALVVDDEPAVASLFAAFLRRLGFTASVALDEAEAVGLLRDRAWDLLLTDLNLGGSGSQGLGLLRLSRQLRTARRTILVSGALAPGAAQPAAGAADHFLAKPVAFDDLAAAVHSLFG
jgi:CheY-like chemotaxis protein